MHLRRRALSLRPVTDEERAEYADELSVRRPKDRLECRDGFRPCPWVGCRYHLGIDLTTTGRLRVPPDREPWEVPETCALDVADHGRVTLEEIGGLLGLTRERVRQIEEIALHQARVCQLGRRMAAEDALLDGGL